MAVYIVLFQEVLRMGMKLEFQSIKNQDIFQPEFEDLTSNGNNTIEFKRNNCSGGIAVVYAPNGTGKTSLAKVLGSESKDSNLSFSATYDKSKTIAPEDKAFHVIADQLSRNVIQGETSDYLIGKDIRREYYLKKKISDGTNTAFANLNAKYKSKYNTSKVNDYFLSAMKNQNYKEHSFIKDIVNRNSRGKGIDRANFFAYLRISENKPKAVDIVENKKEFVINNTELVNQILKFDIDKIVANEEIKEVEQNDDAIRILGKYKDMRTCIVCDNDNIDRDLLLNKKKERQKRIVDNLDEQTKTLLKSVAMDSTLEGNNLFDIKDKVLAFLSSGNEECICSLREEFQFYVNKIIDEMITELFDEFGRTSLYSMWDELTQLQEVTPKLDNEELLYIETIINENIDRVISIKRDEDNDRVLKLMLDDQELPGMATNQMHLSTGEQNFISLAFALLLARHSDQEFVVLDDPISSFDSVYKNKIAFCIVKFLEKKKQIILTHNTDLIRLLHVQLKDCFNLYILNNVESGRNGFISVKTEEKNILISLSELVKFFQNKDKKLEVVIHDKRLFLMSMIPFLRGYFHIINDSDDTYGDLSKVMHGYENNFLDIADVYYKAFGYRIVPEEIISVEDVLNVNIGELDIIDAEQYPLLSDTLSQTLIYYHIRMKVEHELMDIFHIPHLNNEILMLTDIIHKAFGPKQGATQEQNYQVMKDRVFFTSRKTLLNEFNHFEGNMNIFQPAIDITDKALQKEIDAINKKLTELRRDNTPQ